MATVEELQSELETLRSELRQLRDQVVSAPVEEPRGVLSRRNLLKVAPVAAIGTALVALSAGPAAAAAGNPLLLGKSNSAGTGTTELTGGDGTADTPAFAFAGGASGDWLAIEDGNGGTVQIGSADGPAIQSFSLDKLAARFVGGAGDSNAAGGTDAVLIESLGPGTALTITAVDKLLVPEYEPGPTTTEPSTAINISAQTGAGVAATVTGGVGLAATATGDGHAVTAVGTSTTTASDLVTLDYAGTGRAFYAHSHNPTNINGTVTGVNEGHGIGVWGEQRNDTGTGFGLVGLGGALGRGARLSGGAAAFQILPSAAATHPTTGKVGDVFLDKSARLWLCQKASSGSTAAVWKQLA